MSDDQVRAMLLERLDAVAAADEPTSDEYIRSIGQVLSDTWIAFYTPILTAIFGLPVLLIRRVEAFGNFAAAFRLWSPSFQRRSRSFLPLRAIRSAWMP